MQKSNDFEVALHTEPVSPDNKIRQILEVLLLYDPAIETHDVVWEFNGKSRMIKKFEEFPYYLYKAIWDADFKAIQWAAYQNDETMLINYDMIDRLLVDYFDDRQTEDFDIEHNRLRHSLVEIFGFNEIPKENIRQHKNDLQYPDFFNELEECGGPNINHWVEYHHPDFLKRDSSNVDNPKGKNSKFFKLCQTLKMPYRLRKQTTNEGRLRKGRRASGYRGHTVHQDDFYPPLPPPGCVPIAFPGQMPFSNLTNRPFNVDGLRNIPDIHTNENLIIDDNLDQQSIDRAFAESLDTNSVTRESEMLSIDSKSNI